MKLKNIISIKFWLIPLFILLNFGASILFNEQNQIFFLVVVLSVFFLRAKYTVDPGLIVIVLLWLLINLISILIINPNQPYSLITIFSRLIFLFIIYFIVRLLEGDFFDKLNKHVFILTIISIPAFIVQLVFPEIMYNLSSVFSPVTRDFFTLDGSWYSYIFTFNTSHPGRNCGFAWEPGAFAGILIFMIAYRFSLNDFKLDKYIVVYLIGLFSSYSTAGYLAFAVLAFAFYIKYQKKDPLLVPLFLFAIYFSVLFYNNTEFLSGKIDDYINQGTSTWGGIQENMTYRTSRWGYALIVFDESIHWPFGHGIINYSNFMLKEYGRIFGSGSLSTILHQWGWVGLLGTITFIYKFFRRNIDKKTSTLFTLAVLIILFSNPSSFLLLIYSIIFSVIGFKKKIFENKLDALEKVSSIKDKYSKKVIIS